MEFNNEFLHGEVGVIKSSQNEDINDLPLTVEKRNRKKV